MSSSQLRSSSPERRRVFAGSLDTGGPPSSSTAPSQERPREYGARSTRMQSSIVWSSVLAVLFIVTAFTLSVTIGDIHDMIIVLTGTAIMLSVMSLREEP